MGIRAATALGLVGVPRLPGHRLRQRDRHAGGGGAHPVRLSMIGVSLLFAGYVVMRRRVFR